MHSGSSWLITFSPLSTVTSTGPFLKSSVRMMHCAGIFNQSARTLDTQLFPHFVAPVIPIIIGPLSLPAYWILFISLANIYIEVRKIHVIICSLKGSCAAISVQSFAFTCVAVVSSLANHCTTAFQEWCLPSRCHTSDDLQTFTLGFCPTVWPVKNRVDSSWIPLWISRGSPCGFLVDFSVDSSVDFPTIKYHISDHVFFEKQHIKHPKLSRRSSQRNSQKIM